MHEVKFYLLHHCIFLQRHSINTSLHEKVTNFILTPISWIIFAVIYYYMALQLVNLASGLGILAMKVIKNCLEKLHFQNDQMIRNMFRERRSC